jgi:hypothetical protein
VFQSLISQHTPSHPVGRFGVVPPVLCHDENRGPHSRVDAENHGGLNMSDQGSRTWTRKRIVAGAGLAAVLGAGAYAVTTQAHEHGNTTAVERTGAASTSSEQSAAKYVDQQAATPVPSESLTAEQRAAAVRAEAAKHPHPVLRALTPPPGIQLATDIRERDQKRANGSLRIVTARGDLTGQRELLWPADKGRKHGDVTCTQKFHFASNDKPTVRPNMLVCWRTSAAKSVATVLVDFGGHPSAGVSRKTIDREWAKLG